MASKDDISLLEHLDVSQIHCLNEQHAHDLKSILSARKLNTSDSFLLSEEDDQLLLSIPFNQAVRIRTLVVHTKESAQLGPKVIKLRVNQPSIDFNEVEDANDNTFAQVIQLSEADVMNAKPIALRFVRFQSVNSLQIFVESNQGDGQETRIDAIDVRGLPVEMTKNLSGLRQEEA
ncbi:DUF1000-domain-containing protein [Phlebopus sp. FC_14]|nr:DUF1000-domain-containing protein [Phlebopus sp. FC_14]